MRATMSYEDQRRSVSSCGYLRQDGCVIRGVRRPVEEELLFLVSHGEEQRFQVKYKRYWWGTCAQVALPDNAQLLPDGCRSRGDLQDVGSTPREAHQPERWAKAAFRSCRRYFGRGIGDERSDHRVLNEVLGAMKNNNCDCPARAF